MARAMYYCGRSYFAAAGLIVLSAYLVNFKNVSADENASVSADNVTNISVSYCEFHTTHQFAVELVREAYRRIGITAHFTSLPCRRSLAEANSGRFDAEVSRIAGTNWKFKNLTPTDSPVVTIEGVVITKEVTRDIRQWSDLKGLRVGIIRGELYAEKGTVSHQVLAAESYSQLLTRLARGDVDVAIVIRRDYELVVRSPEFWNEKIYIIGQPLFAAPLYHHVHKINKTVLDRLNPIITKMWENGDTAAIHQKTFNAMTNQ